MSDVITWDETVVFHEQMEPLINQLHEIAKQHKIPLLITVAIAQDENESTTMAGTVHLNPEGRSVDAMSAAHKIMRANGLEEFITMIERRFMLKTVLDIAKGGKDNAAETLMSRLMGGEEKSHEL